MILPSDLACVRTTGPLGPMLLAASDRGLAGVWFHDQRHLPPRRDWREDERHPVLRLAVAQLGDYLRGARSSFDLPLDFVAGTPFQHSVWQSLLRIPFGATATYADIARGLGKPRAMRAVGAAVGRNPLSIVVPCHRVLGSSGSLTGYAGGLDRKTALLRLERADCILAAS